MHLQPLHSITDVPPSEWNALVGDYPFLRHEFLRALEHHDCLDRSFGWIPWYCVLRDPETDHIAAAAPTFVKLNSWGEFVFDFAWADAFERHGLAYYPKLIAAAPYTPANGPRVLVADGYNPAATRARLLQAVREHADAEGWSGVHWLFPDASDLEALRADGLLVRTDIQYHWQNDGYADFEDFLGRFNSRKRKKVKRERRRVAEQGVTLVRRRGCDMDAREWSLAFHFYAATFEKKWNVPVLSRDFFAEIGRTLGEHVWVVFALHEGREVAASILFSDDTTLYGRYWGCDADYHSLHFEACYYQGIDLAIANGLQRFAPGAQGEHKIARGFLPTYTHSAHWIRHPQFREAIADYLERERQAVEWRYTALQSWSPYRDASHEAA